MPAEPTIVERSDQPYVAIKGLVTMRTMGTIIDRMPEVFGWLSARGVEPAGPPIFKYNVIDMERQLEMEVGVPVADTVEGDDQVLSGVLPAGRYATAIHIGHPDKLVDATTALLEWAALRGLRWDKTETADGERWGCRLEAYLTDPAEEPDMDKWETELAFRLAD